MGPHPEDRLIDEYTLWWGDAIADGAKIRPFQTPPWWQGFKDRCPQLFEKVAEAFQAPHGEGEPKWK